MILKVPFAIAFFVSAFPVASHAVSIQGQSEEAIQITASVPIIKMRQGEKFTLFDGTGGGLRWSPWLDNEKLKPIHFSGLFMVSTTSEVDSSNPSNKEHKHIFSFGIVAGYSWLQLGVGWDLISSEAKEVFREREKTFFMLNLGGSIKF